MYGCEISNVQRLVPAPETKRCRVRAQPRDDFCSPASRRRTQGSGEAAHGELDKPALDHLLAREDVAQQHPGIVEHAARVLCELGLGLAKRELCEHRMRALGARLLSHHPLDVPAQRHVGFLRDGQLHVALRVVHVPKVDAHAVVVKVLDVMPPVLRQEEHVAGLQDRFEWLRVRELWELGQVDRAQVKRRLPVARVEERERVKARPISGPPEE
mmetsp:Transcript_4955/g.15441  ORF Transcript_4955/g.15441 Transcript_4955/m.15441 type:complete len:214 (+) Transcript_4955:404-1045(+)